MLVYDDITRDQLFYLHTTWATRVLERRGVSMYTHTHIYILLYILNYYRNRNTSFWRAQKIRQYLTIPRVLLVKKKKPWADGIITEYDVMEKVLLRDKHTVKIF